MFHDASSTLPEMYSSWLREALDAELPGESRATCSDCAMCPSDGEKVAGVYPFRPDVKCCAYTPRLPNFLAGQILTADDLPHGVTTVSARLEARSGVDPLGIGIPPARRVLYDRSVNIIGRSQELRCPYFVDEDGSCGIWKYRNHLCSTWFCKHERGALGMAFWVAVKALLESIERDLSYWAALEAGVSATALRQLMTEVDKKPDAPIDADDVDGVISDHRYAALWDGLAGGEAEFYKSCAERVSGLSWAEVLGICGPEVLARLEVVKLASAGLSMPIKFLRTGSYQLIGVNSDGISAVTYSSLDPIAVPQPILTILHLFDGSPVEQIFEKIELDYGIRMSDELVSQLVDYQFLLTS